MTAHDDALQAAASLVQRSIVSEAARPVIKAFFDEPTWTVSYVVRDPRSRAAAIIDSVLDFDPAPGRTWTESADEIVRFVQGHDLTVEWLLETHAHADHLSAATYLQEKLGGKLAIGREILRVQEFFGKLFNAGAAFARDGSQFDHLFADGERFTVGGLDGVALHLPGHTPADLAYVIGDAVFTGDTLFMPDYGTARADFPGGDARQLYRSIRRLLSLPAETRLFMCHDYKAPNRNEYRWETTVAEERAHNVHVHEGISENEFVAMREARDRTLPMPRLILASVQINMRAGHLPEPENNGIRYLKLPLNAL
jgi:glyoxylase-like metal-dependent hydrolase (beta-lactamase superfamily II)